MDEYHKVEEEEKEEEWVDGGRDVSLTQLLKSAQSGQVRDFSISSPESEVCNTFQCISSSFDVVNMLNHPVFVIAPFSYFCFIFFTCELPGDPAEETIQVPDS